MSDFEFSLNDMLADTFNYVLKYEEEALKKSTNLPLTVTEAHILEAIGRIDQGATISEIASILRVSLPTVTVAIKKLESKGFIKKQNCKVDGRRTIVELTESGKKANRAHSVFHRKMVKNISREFSEEEKEVLLCAIKKLNHFFREKVEEK